MRAALRVLSVTALTLATAACSGAAPSAAPPTAAPSAAPSVPPAGSLPPAPSGSAVTGPTAAPPTAAPPTAPPPTAAPPTAAPPSSGPTAGAIDHPTDASAVILRVQQAGGLVMPGFQFARGPAFTLYGDGTVIYRAPDTGILGDTQPPFQVAHMDEDQIQALLRFALGVGHLQDARAQYLNPLIADAPDTVFTLSAGEYSKKVQVQALSEGSAQPADAADIAGFVKLNELLSDFGKQVLSGQATGVGAYEPVGYLAQLMGGDAPGAGATPWPWPEITKAQLVKDANGFFTVTLSAAQAAKITTVPSGGLMGKQLAGPDGKAYLISIRPLLPDDLAQDVAG